MAQRLAVYQKDEESLENEVMQMFPILTDETENDVRLLMEKYMLYKKDYMKHLQFDPALENLNYCKFSFLSQN